VNVRQQLLLEYEGLAEGTSIAGEQCPACNGGETKERTLSVSKAEGRLLWKCHRASCGFAGGSGTSAGSTPRRTLLPSCRGIAGRDYSRTSCRLNEQAKQYLGEKYWLTEQHLARNGVGYDEQSGRVVIPIKDFHGQERGSTLRGISGEVPKSLIYAEPSAISWHTNRKSQALIVVEDQWSAIRASDYMNAVALLGTYLDDERAYEIRASKLSPIYMALDLDAWDKTVKYCVKYRSLLSPIPVKIGKDLKDMSPQELEELLCSI